MILIRVPLVIRFFDYTGDCESAFLGTAIDKYVYYSAGRREPDKMVFANLYSDLFGDQTYLYGELGADNAADIAQDACKRHLDRKWHANRDLAREPFWTAAACGGTVFYQYKQESIITRSLNNNPRPLFSHLLLIKLKNSDAAITNDHPTDVPRSKIAYERLAEAAVSALQRDDLPRFGEALDQSLRVMASLGRPMTAECSRVYALARLSGAYGGAVNGRFLALIAPPEKHEKIIDALRADTDRIAVSFDLQGCSVVYSSLESQ